MKRKTLITLGVAYLVFVAIVLVVGLRINKTSLTPTVTLWTAISAEGETTSAKGGFSPTTGETGSPTAALTGVDTTPAQPSPSLTSTSLRTHASPVPSDTLRTSTAAFVVTPTKTPRSSLLTATQDAYPINGDSTATQTPYPVEESPTHTAMVNRTPTCTATPVKQTGWEGEWEVWFEQEDGIYVSGKLNISLYGSDLSAVGSIGGEQYTFEGIIYQNEEQATGPWTSQMTTGYFWWLLRESDQFSGCWDDQYGFCGARNDLNQPLPCFMFPPS